MYANGEGTMTLKSLLKQAQGLADDAFTTRAILYREGEGETLKANGVPLGDILAGRSADINLKPTTYSWYRASARYSIRAN